MNDSIIEAVSFFRKACVEFGMSPSHEALGYMLRMQRALFAVIEQASPAAAERDGYATGGFVGERPPLYVGEDPDAAFILERLASLGYADASLGADDRHGWQALMRRVG